MNKKTLKIIIALVIVLSLAGGSVALYYFFKGADKTVDVSKVDFTISAEDLATEFRNDDKKSNEKFVGKNIKLSGEVQQVEVKKNEGENVSDDVIVTLKIEGGDGLDAVICQLDAGQKYEGKQGDKVTFIGACSGGIVDIALGTVVNLSKCVHIK